MPGSAVGGYGKKCEFCSRMATRACRKCNKLICEKHYNYKLSMCMSCAAAQLTPGTVEHKLEKECAVCSKEAKHVCKLCGRSVCDMHFKVADNMCIMCWNKKQRQEAKET